MFKKHEMVPSREMDRPMHLWRYGTFGLPVLVFPSAAGMAHEWEAHGMVDALGDLIDAGKLKLYCTESNVAEAWTRRENPAPWRIQRHQAYERYVVNELTPFIREDCRSDSIPIAVTGTSLGAFYSANFCLKHPTIFRWALCMSGRYDTSWLTDGFNSSDVYFNNPMAFVPNLSGPTLEQIRQLVHLVLVCGQGKWEDGNIEDTRAMAGLLDAKGISHECDLWGQDVAHEWTWWKRQARHHLLRLIAAND
ncbi:MAG: esterase [Acidobacteria bacterium]|nr:esterase [Acidobacteriota bacterium]NIM60726.1 esterase [Acidobacteriota bacterium]NIO59546.1 esterase [Acidobacteriota bacterium]NIQ30567.1 esterase [Acidobacteriota bacterium]NIQ85532.1 esterase [Acidobacteriota bacterium]